MNIQYLKYLICFFVILFFVNCKNENRKIQRKKIGDYTIEAYFKNDSVIDGTARFFESSNRLVSVVNYINGEKNGYAVNFYQNGITKDSMNFNNGLKNGFQYFYDTIGRLSAISFEYYGLRMGPQLFFKNGNVENYYYTDFNKEDLIGCKYDSIGLLKEISSFTTNPGIAQVKSEGQKMLELFFYLPNPPDIEVEYAVGITDKNRTDKQLFFIDNKRVIFDSLMPYPQLGWHYFISAHLKNVNGSINKIFIDEIKDSVSDGSVSD